MDITEALKLSKNIKNLDEAKGLCNWVGDYTNDGLLKFIEYQQQEIERLNADKWISVNDRLPDDCNFVLIFTIYGTRYMASYVDTTNEWIWGKNEWKALEVTHWQPLPTAPEDSDE